MSTSAQLKTRGYLLLVSFFAVLIAIFMPLFPAPHTDKKVNGLDYLDNFFNELSKGSAYYIPAQMKAAEKYKGQEFTTTLKMKSPESAAVIAKLFATNNIEATAEAEKVMVKGDFGAIIAIIHHFFHSEFDKIDPSVSIAIEDAVKRNILDPYLDIKERKANQWLGYYGGMINNWNPWCNSDAILCFLLMEKDQARLDAAVRQGIESIDMFLDYNTSDGACEEGPAYWDAAAGKLYDFLQILYDASSGKFAIFDNPRIKRMGEFISRSYIGDGFAANFADGSALATSTPEMVWAYGKAVRSKEILTLAMIHPTCLHLCTKLLSKARKGDAIHPEKSALFTIY